MRDPVKPRAQGSGVLEPSNSAKDLHPHVLQDIERRFRVPSQLGGVVEKGPLHYGDQVLEAGFITSLAAECDPLILNSARPVRRIHLSLMSKESSQTFKPSLLQTGKESVPPTPAS